MVIQLDNGQSVTIFENQNVLRQIRDYIDEEIYELLEDTFGYLEQPTPNDLLILSEFDDLMCRETKHCSVGEYSYSYFCTMDGAILMFEIEDSSIYEICDENKIKKIILTYKDIRNDLINNNIISKQYVEKIKKEQEEQNKIKEKLIQKEQDKRDYEEYLKLKEKFGGDK